VSANQVHWDQLWCNIERYAQAPLVKDGRVVNVASSIVTTPLIKSGPCSDTKGLSVVRVVFVKRTSGAWSSGTESIKAESMVL
ncbi:unnamed protein product, partial [Ascophyllum nodosum]